MSTYLQVPASQLVPSKTLSQSNRRNRYDPAKLQELADSIRSIGMQQPIICRPLSSPSPHSDGERGPGGEGQSDAPKKRGRPPKVTPETSIPDPSAPIPMYEIVAGERRWTAAKLLDPDWPCEVKLENLTDEEALSIEVTENNQREEPHPVDEGDAFAALLKFEGNTVESIAKKIGRQVRYVNERIRLANLSDLSREALDKGYLTVGYAVPLAALDQAKQDIALASPLGLRDQTWEINQYVFKGLNGSLPRLSVDNFRKWVARNATQEMRNAFWPLDIVLGELPACDGCPNRTTNKDNLFSTMDSDLDACSDFACWTAKKTLAVERAIEDSKAGKGLPVVNFSYKSGKGGVLGRNTVDRSWRAVDKVLAGDDENGSLFVAINVEPGREGEQVVCRRLTPGEQKALVDVPPSVSPRTTKEAQEQNVRTQAINSAKSEFRSAWRCDCAAKLSGVLMENSALATTFLGRPETHKLMMEYLDDALEFDPELFGLEDENLVYDHSDLDLDNASIRLCQVLMSTELSYVNYHNELPPYIEELVKWTDSEEILETARRNAYDAHLLPLKEKYGLADADLETKA